LEDVALQLGLCVDGKLVTGPTYYDWKQICIEYIGVVPPKNALVGLTLKLKWLKESMLTLPVEPTLQQLATRCRVYILGLFDGMLMPDKSGNIDHLMYLPLLGYLDRIDR